MLFSCQRPSVRKWDWLCSVVIGVIERNAIPFDRRPRPYPNFIVSGGVTISVLAEDSFRLVSDC